MVQEQTEEGGSVAPLEFALMKGQTHDYLNGPADNKHFLKKSGTRTYEHTAAGGIVRRIQYPTAQYPTAGFFLRFATFIGYSDSRE